MSKNDEEPKTGKEAQTDIGTLWKALPRGWKLVVLAFAGASIFFVGVLADHSVSGKVRQRISEFEEGATAIAARQDSLFRHAIQEEKEVQLEALDDSIQKRTRALDNLFNTQLDSVRPRVNSTIDEELGGLRSSIEGRLRQVRADADSTGALLRNLRTQREEANSLVQGIRRLANTDVLTDTLTQRLVAWANTDEVLARLRETHPAVSFNPGSASFLGTSGKSVAEIGRHDNGGGYARFYDAGGRYVAYIGVQGDSTGGVIEVNGRTFADVAEMFDAVGQVEIPPGTVVSVLPPAGRIGPSERAYDNRVVGVVSGAGGLRPGITLGGDPEGAAARPVAVLGQVYVRVNLEGGALRPGDLVVSSSVPGVAMRAADRARITGTVVGKALGSFTGRSDAAEGLVRILVMAR